MTSLKTTTLITLNLVALAATLLTLKSPPPPPPPRAAAAAAVFAGKIVSGQLDEENPFMLISSGLLVQPDEGVSDLVADRIGVKYHLLNDIVAKSLTTKAGYFDVVTSGRFKMMVAISTGKID
ncbi:hypothetical protein F511_12288 [Dorcoceras hygrometricum]|uniref:Uncharacterized protein n=1 Tax=Dorcoceras hygrometricum TaxID=472368 RepID=A0A2Z7BQ84_9LAMI|nr:hypothetical protein F511_12288 [Dorcoceras hygrometricum]